MNQTYPTYASYTRNTFLGLAIKAIKEYLGDNKYFTVDEVRTYAEQTSDIGAYTVDGRQWGAAILKAKSLGMVTKHGTVNVNYRHKGCNSAPRAVWQAA